MHPHRSDGEASGSHSQASSASSSFLVAMDQLNVQYPPTHSGDTSYSPLQPVSPSVPPLSSSLAQSPQGQATITNPPPRSQPQPSRSSPPPAMTLQQYDDIAARYTLQIAKDWVPNVMSDSEIEAYRRATQRRLGRIHALEAEQQRHAPQISDRIEQALFMARLDYRIRFYRVFRINDLPTEILTNIFHFIAWSAPEPRSAVQWRVWLTSVCRHWRTIAIQESTLWNAVWFRNSLRFEQPFAWLDRAGSSFVDVRINDSPQQPLTLETITQLINRLFEKLSNIRVMIVVVQDWDPALYIVHALRRVAEERLPMIMERFELHRAGSAYVQVGVGYEPSFYIRPMTLFGGALVPTFRYLAVNGVHIDWENSPIVNLTAFDMRRMPLEKIPSLEQFRTILRKCPDLNKLVLDGAGPQWPRTLDSVSHLQPVPLPNLKILVLGDFSINYGTYLCSQISCRNVVDLTLINLLGDDASPFFKGLTGSLTAVKTLTLHIAEVLHPQSYAAVFKWLQTLPVLTYLRVVNVRPNFLDLFLHESEALLPGNVRAIVCPKLAYLEFHSVDPDHIATWVRSRKLLGAPLRKVFLGTETLASLSKDQLARLKEVMRSPNGNGIQVLGPTQRAPEEEALVL